MRTDTREKLLKLIRDDEKARPYDLRKALGISGQALHRHLKDLVRKGVLETEGSAPRIFYKLSGWPDFDAAARWMNSVRRICATGTTRTSSPSSTDCSRRSSASMSGAGLTAAAMASTRALYRSA